MYLHTPPALFMFRRRAIARTQVLQKGPKNRRATIQVPSLQQSSNRMLIQSLSSTVDSISSCRRQCRCRSRCRCCSCCYWHCYRKSFRLLRRPPMHHPNQPLMTSTTRRSQMSSISPPSTSRATWTSSMTSSSTALSPPRRLPHTPSVTCYRDVPRHVWPMTAIPLNRVSLGTCYASVPPSSRF